MLGDSRKESASGSCHPCNKTIKLLSIHGLSGQFLFPISHTILKQCWTSCSSLSISCSPIASANAVPFLETRFSFFFSCLRNSYSIVKIQLKLSTVTVPVPSPTLLGALESQELLFASVSLVPGKQQALKKWFFGIYTQINMFFVYPQRTWKF